MEQRRFVDEVVVFAAEQVHPLPDRQRPGQDVAVQPDLAAAGVERAERPDRQGQGPLDDDVVRHGDPAVTAAAAALMRSFHRGGGPSGTSPASSPVSAGSVGLAPIDVFTVACATLSIWTPTASHAIVSTVSSATRPRVDVHARSLYLPGSRTATEFGLMSCSSSLSVSSISRQA